jgi:hypothetical protein
VGNERPVRQIDREQRALCERYGVTFVEAPLSLKVGVSRVFDLEKLPLHGLRHSPQGGTSGWYFWTGEYSSEPDFFVPIHGEHLIDRCPELIRFLGLAPGWRFLLAPRHDDVWFDPSLLDG